MMAHDSPTINQVRQSTSPLPPAPLRCHNGKHTSCAIRGTLRTNASFTMVLPGPVFAVKLLGLVQGVLFTLNSRKALHAVRFSEVTDCSVGKWSKVLCRGAQLGCSRAHDCIVTDVVTYGLSAAHRSHKLAAGIPAAGLCICASHRSGAAGKGRPTRVCFLHCLELVVPHALLRFGLSPQLLGMAAPTEAGREPGVGSSR